MPEETTTPELDPSIASLINSGAFTMDQANAVGNPLGLSQGEVLGQISTATGLDRATIDLAIQSGAPLTPGMQMSGATVTNAAEGIGSSGAGYQPNVQNLYGVTGSFGSTAEYEQALQMAQMQQQIGTLSGGAQPAGQWSFGDAYGGGAGGTGGTAAETGLSALNAVDERFADVALNQNLQAIVPSLKPGTEFAYTNQQVQGDELLASQQLGADPTAATALQSSATQVQAPDAFDASGYNAFTNFVAAQMTPAQLATLSPEAQMEAAQGTMSPESTVQFQLAQLLDQFDDDKIPPWAAGAIRQANAVMAKRGLGASTMVGEAHTTAAMESALPIATADAGAHMQLQLANLQNRQDANKFNATAFAQLDMANLTNAQQAATVNMQAKQQKLMSDQAAINASEQFNAQSQNQVDQFFAQLGSQIAIANADRMLAVDTANVNQINAQQRFNASLVDARDKFNMEASLQIAQSNANWRRSINTANTAAQNETNRMNTQNLFNITQAAQANLWQQYRDEAHWAITSAENDTARRHNIAMVALTNDLASNNMNNLARQDMYKTLGGFGMSFFQGVYNASGSTTEAT